MKIGWTTSKLAKSKAALLKAYDDTPISQTRKQKIPALKLKPLAAGKVVPPKYSTDRPGNTQIEQP